MDIDPKKKKFQIWILKQPKSHILMQKPLPQNSDPNNCKLKNNPKTQTEA